MDLAAWVGGAATVASTVSFTPQAWKVIRTRRTEGISVRTYSVTVTAFACWLVYGLLLGAWPIIVSNIVCLAFSIFILVMTILPRASREAVAGAIAAPAEDAPNDQPAKDQPAKDQSAKDQSGGEAQKSA